MKDKPKKPGRPKDPNSLRSKGLPRYKNPRVVFHCEDGILAALKSYRDTLDPRPEKAEVWRAAMRAFLREKGFWPPNQRA